MVDKELIENWRNMVKLPISSLLFKTNYEGMGEQDKEEFERDFDEILDLALIGLKYKAQLSQEGTTKGTPYLKEYATADSDTAIGGLREMGDNLLREIHSRAMSRMGDCISRKDAIRWIKTECNPYGKPTLDFESGKRVMKHLEQIPPAQPKPSEITDEQAILHLQSTGWMRNHDREMYESGLREQLADDSGGYDSLIPCEDTISRQAAHISVMVKKWRDEQNERTD